MEPGIDNVHVEVEEVAASERAAEAQLVLEWRVEQLEHLGLSQVIARAFASHVDWHQVAKLVSRGCPPDLALEIVR